MEKTSLTRFRCSSNGTVGWPPCTERDGGTARLGKSASKERQALLLWLASSPSWNAGRRPITPSSPCVRPASRRSTSLPTNSDNATSTWDMSPSRKVGRCTLTGRGPAHETKSTLHIQRTLPGASRRHVGQHGGGDGLHIHLYRHYGRGSVDAEDSPAGALLGSQIRYRRMLRRSRPA